MLRPILFVVLLLRLSGGSYAQTLHLVLVADLDDNQFKINSLQSQEQILEIMETVAQKIAYKLQPTYLNKNAFTSDAIKSTIKKLITTPNDLMVVYYTGLGYYPANSSSNYPFLQVTNYQKKPISLDEIGNLLLEKQVRLGIAMADCRDSELTVEKTIVERYPPPQAMTVIQADLRKLLLKTMFLGPCGLLKVASTQRNQKAFLVKENLKTILVSIGSQTDTLNTYNETGQKGAIFTYSFYNSFKESLKSVSVEDIPNASLSQLLQNTQQMMTNELNPMKNTNNVQTVRWEFSDCSTVFQQKIVKLPSYLYPKDRKELDVKLNQMIATTDKRLRNEFAARLNDLFTANAFVTVIQTNDYPPEHPKFKTRINRLTAENYLNSLAASAEKIKKVTIKNTVSLDFEGFPLVTMEIEEVWKEF
ncbi:MAG: caspase family protein [Spirosomataceae bacterium]